MTRFGIIVDGYSTGSGFAREFLKYNILCVHVQTQLNIPKVYSHTYNSADYEANYIFNDNLNFIAQQLKRYQPEFVIAGAECGVEFADILSEYLELPGNDTQLSPCRRNKYLMQERVKSKGLKSIPSFEATTLKDAINWAIEQNSWPLVVKPLASAGGEGVKVCYNLAEIKAAYHDIMSTKINMLGFENIAVILQYYIQGHEYVVNTVSYAGKHKFCELWYYTRHVNKNGQQIYSKSTGLSISKINGLI